MAASDAIEEIKSRLSILDVVGPRVTLRKAGRNFQGLCPFHSEKTPSFVVFPEKGNYHCFGCGANGDAFTFVMQTENLEFVEALRLLADRTGVTLVSRRAATVEDRRNALLVEINAATAQFFQTMLRREAGGAALTYLHGRGLTEDTIDAFQLGWAPDSWEALTRQLLGRGHTAADLVAAGVASERESGGIYDRFRNRVTFPIRDERGGVVGFGARALGDEHPKYLNSPDTPIFSKGHCLYGIDAARPAIREAGQAVIVEGYVDALIAHQYGLKNVVASLGTALTERQLAMLKRLTRSIVLALDPDTAGADATARGLEVARQVFAEVTPVATWRGLIRHEHKLGADLRVARLPSGQDPDEIIRESADRWRLLIREAQPLVDFTIDVVLAKVDVSTAKGKSAAAQQLLPLLAELRDPVQQAHYVGLLAQRLRVREDALASSLRRVPFIRKRALSPHGVRTSPPGPPFLSGSDAERGEEGWDEAPVEADQGRRGRPTLAQHLLSLLLRYEDLASAVWDVDPGELTELQAREVLRLLQVHVGERGRLDRDEFLTELPELLQEWVAELRAAEGERPELRSSVQRSDLKRCVDEIRRGNLREEIRRIERVLSGIEPGEPGKPGEPNRDDLEGLRQRIASLLTRLLPYEREPSRPLARNWREGVAGG
ncbi:MAG: DNA primase [Chloroflexi bacterium]|nr:DNA primase [Chloroflexota bacterium]